MFKGIKDSTYTPTAVYVPFTGTNANVFFSLSWVKERKKAALPGMRTILSDALMSLAEPKAFKGRCTLPSLVSHSFLKQRNSSQRKGPFVWNCNWSAARDKGSSFNRNPNNDEQPFHSAALVSKAELSVKCCTPASLVLSREELPAVPCPWEPETSMSPVNYPPLALQLHPKHPGARLRE